MKNSLTARNYSLLWQMCQEGNAVQNDDIRLMSCLCHCFFLTFVAATKTTPKLHSVEQTSSSAVKGIILQCLCYPWCSHTTTYTNRLFWMVLGDHQKTSFSLTATHLSQKTPQKRPSSPQTETVITAVIAGLYSPATDTCDMRKVHYIDKMTKHFDCIVHKQ